MFDSLKVFDKFIHDPEAWDMYITGRAGTGKTTDCGMIVEYCLQHNIEHVICAFTHKACRVLKSKLPAGANIVTLHKYLNKRPTLNTQATRRAQLHSNQQMSQPDQVKLIIIDEYSMVGERDYADIRALQDEDYDGNAEVKVLWLGDPYQLPPVGDAQAVKPEGNYQVVLKEIKRQATDNPLAEPIAALVSYIEGESPKALLANSNFVRGVDLAFEYAACVSDNKVLLCYTNKAVQDYNWTIAGKSAPTKGDKLWSPDLQQFVTFERILPRSSVDYVDLAFGERLVLNTKYRTLEYLLKSELYDFCEVIDEDGNIMVYAFSFGHYTYKTIRDTLSEAATKSNKDIQLQVGQSYQPAAWAKANDKHPLARARAKAWRDFLSFNDCVICLDFPHAMTVHKSQGSTFDYVFVDTQDIGQLANTNWQMYLKLMYVALSRAAKKVYTN